MINKAVNTIKPFAQQQQLINKALDTQTNVIIYGGGIRGGKTFAALIALLLYNKMHSLKAPRGTGSKVTVVRESLQSLKRNTKPSYYKLFPDVSNQIINESTQTIKYNHGGELLWFGENYARDKELNRWKGFETNAMLLEEINELQLDSFYKAIERSGSWVVPGLPINGQPMPKVIGTCNPSRGWVKELIYDRWRNGTLPKNWCFIPSLMDDNPHISDAYKTSLLDLPQWVYDVYVKGDWDALVLDNLFCDSFNKDIHVFQGQYEDIYNPRLDIYLSFDFNITNTITVWQHDDTKIRCIREYHMQGRDLEYYCKQVIADYGNHFYYINGDASGNAGNALTSENKGAYEIIAQLMGLAYEQFEVPLTNPSIKSSKIITNIILKKEDIQIHHSCTGLIKDCEEVQIERNGNRIEIVKKDNALTHHLDTMRYYIATNHAWRISNYGLADVVNSIT